MMLSSWTDGIRLRLVQFAAPVEKARERWRGCEIYLFALLIFAASRVVVGIGVSLGTLLVQTVYYKIGAGEAWYLRLARWDAGWYGAIVRDGYGYNSDPTAASSVVFYPLYPLFAYVVKSLLGIDEYLALLIVSNLASLATVLLMTKFVRDELGDEIALYSLALFCFFPTSLFLSAAYTESLFLMFALLSLILLTRGRFVLAAVLAGLSFATRSTGIVMMPVILWEIWRQNTLPPSRLLLRMALCGVLAASGLLVYMAYLGIEFGHPLAFVTGQAAWHPGVWQDQFVAVRTFHLFRLSSYKYGGWFISFLVLTIWSFRRLPSAVCLYALGTLMLPYLTLGITESMNRFVLVCFPVFMCVGVICKGRPWFVSVLTGIYAALLVQTAALFSQLYWVG